MAHQQWVHAEVASYSVADATREKQSGGTTRPKPHPRENSKSALRSHALRSWYKPVLDESPNSSTVWFGPSRHWFNSPCSPWTRHKRAVKRTAPCQSLQNKNGKKDIQFEPRVDIFTARLKDRWCVEQMRWWKWCVGVWKCGSVEVGGGGG